MTTDACSLRAPSTQVNPPASALTQAEELLTNLATAALADTAPASTHTFSGIHRSEDELKAILANPAENDPQIVLQALKLFKISSAGQEFASLIHALNPELIHHALNQMWTEVSAYLLQNHISLCGNHNPLDLSNTTAVNALNKLNQKPPKPLKLSSQATTTLILLLTTSKITEETVDLFGYNLMHVAALYADPFLHAACRTKHFNLLKSSRDGLTPLHMAAAFYSNVEYSKVECCKMICNAVKAAGGHIDPQTTTGLTPYLIAIATNNIEVANIFETQGANTQHQDHFKNNAMHYSAVRDDVSTITELLSQNDNQIDQTPAACFENHRDSRCDVRNQIGQTPAACFKNHHKSRCLDLPHFDILGRLNGGGGGYRIRQPMQDEWYTDMILDGRGSHVAYGTTPKNW